MNPVIAISKSELIKYHGSEQQLSAYAIKLKEVRNFNIYISRSNIQLMEFICYLRDANILFQFYTTEEDLTKFYDSLSKKTN